MTETKSTISRAVAAIVACRGMTLAYLCFVFVIGVLQSLEAEDTGFSLETGLTIGEAFAEAGLIYVFCLFLLGIERTSAETKKSVWQFTARYLLLIFMPFYLISFAAVFGVIYGLSSLLTSLEGMLVLLLPIMVTSYLLLLLGFGTALPSKLVGTQAGISEALRRGRRQFRYQFPRLLVGVVSLNLLAAAVQFLAEGFAINPVPVSSDGGFDLPGSLIHLGVRCIDMLALAVLSVVVCEAYLRDLRDQGELISKDVEVFS